MFRKLLKYDMRSVWRVWRVMAVVVFLMSVVGAFVLRFLIKNVDKIYNSPALSTLSAFFIAAVWLSVFSTVVLTAVLVYSRFYKNFFTDEGYLTFTLPVSRSQLLLSKTANAVIWSVLLFAFWIICSLPFAIISPMPEEGELVSLVVFEWIGELFKGGWEEIGVWLIVYIVEALIFGICALAYSTSLFQLCITVGAAIAKKSKILAAIGLYYVFSMIASAVQSILSTLFAVSLGEGLSTLLVNASEDVEYFAMSLVTMIVCMMLAAAASILHSITLGCLERKLNLA